MTIAVAYLIGTRLFRGGSVSSPSGVEEASVGDRAGVAPATAAAPTRASGVRSDGRTDPGLTRTRRDGAGSVPNTDELPGARPTLPRGSSTSTPRLTDGRGAKAAAPLEEKADLDVARDQVEAKLYDQALSGLRAFQAKYPQSALAPDALFLAAEALDKQGKIDDAMASYVEIRNRHKDSKRAPEAGVRLAEVMLRAQRKGKEEDARRTLAVVADRYPKDPWALRALDAKAALEERMKAKEMDTELAASVPSALVTYRRLIRSFPAAPASEAARWRAGALYEDIKRFDLADEVYEDLGTQFPGTKFDAWFRAAELAEKKLKDKDRALAAYGRVQPSSPSFKDAQKRIAKLSK